MKKNCTWFDQLKIGDIQVKNRIVMSPLTRCRCEQKHGIANQMIADHYSTRADFGLLIAECSAIDQRGNTFPHSPCIYTDEMVKGWKITTDAVHKKGGKIVLQIWHAGRWATKNQTDGLEPWAPSAVGARGMQRLFHYPFETPHEMTLEEIKIVIKQFRKGAENAKKAGFDGIELHGAHGFLVDNFIRDFSNKRTDEYGGTVEKRCRFPLEVMDELIAVFGAGKVGIRLSPVNREADMYDSDPLKTYTYLIKELNKKGIAFLDLREPEPVEDDNEFGFGGKQIPDVCKAFRPLFKGIIIANQGFDAKTGLEKINSGDADLIAFGIPAMINPDLVNRIKHGYPFNQNLDVKTMFTQEAKGYNDYPTYEQEQKQLKK